MFNIQSSRSMTRKLFPAGIYPRATTVSYDGGEEGVELLELAAPPIVKPFAFFSMSSSIVSTAAIGGTIFLDNSSILFLSTSALANRRLMLNTIHKIIQPIMTIGEIIHASEWLIANIHVAPVGVNGWVEFMVGVEVKGV